MKVEIANYGRKIVVNVDGERVTAPFRRGERFSFVCSDALTVEEKAEVRKQYETLTSPATKTAAQQRGIVAAKFAGQDAESGEYFEIGDAIVKSPVGWVRVDNY